MKSSRRWEEIEISPSQARMFIKVAEELTGNRSTSNTLGLDALYLIATLPGEDREVEHELPFGKRGLYMSELTISDKSTSELSNDLPDDLNVITTEINAYKRVAGEAIFEIGRRLKGVRDNPEKYGLEGYRDWERWCKEEVDMSRQYANQFIRIYEELGNSGFRDMSVKALYQIATMPKEARDKEHELPSGETKKPEDMTVRELRELKRKLKFSFEVGNTDNFVNTPN